MGQHKFEMNGKDFTITTTNQNGQWMAEFADTILRTFRDTEEDAIDALKNLASLWKNEKDLKGLALQGYHDHQEAMLNLTIVEAHANLDKQKEILSKEDFAELLSGWSMSANHHRDGKGQWAGDSEEVRLARAIRIDELLGRETPFIL